MTSKQKRIISITLASWGIILIGSGLIMDSSIKPIINTTYELAISQRKVSEAKTNEIILKDITIEINNPLSVDVKDYLENVEQIDDSTLKSLKLDTSMVKINEAGKYTYTITYKKKKYNGTITVKEKEQQNVDLVLKDIKIETKGSLPIPNESNNYDYSFYIQNVDKLTIEMRKSIILDLSKVNTTIEGPYNYTITYNGRTYIGNITVYNPRPNVITPNTSKEPTPSPSPSASASPEPTTSPEEK